MVDSANQQLATARKVVAGIGDPELPSLSIVDLGIVRSVEEQLGTIVVTITPTYSGCPAIRMIEGEIASGLRSAGIDLFRIETTLSPAWSSAWITETGRQQLLESGIAPPPPGSVQVPVVMEFTHAKVSCPSCNSSETELVSQFGSTACKAYYRCTGCLSTFEYFKPL